MISESHYWKRELLRIAARLRKRLAQTRWPEASFSSVEMNLMVGFYAVRKLAEAKKISDDVVARQISLKAYRTVGVPVHRENSHKIDELFDFTSPVSVNRSLPFLWNQLIHSYIFVPVLGETRGLDSVLFCSDRERNALLYQFPLSSIVNLFETVGQNDPGSYQGVYNPKAKEWDVSVGPHLEMPEDAQLTLAADAPQAARR